MRRGAPLLGLLLVLLSSSLAVAQPSVEQVVPSLGEQAIQKGHEALTLFERGRWEEASRVFAQADLLFHSPVFVLFQARSQRNLGRFREAKRMYELLGREPLADEAPAPWREAQHEGAKELEELERIAPRLLIEVEGETEGVHATIDGAALEVGVASLQDPGEHLVRVTRGAQQLERTIKLRVADPGLSNPGHANVQVREVFRFPLRHQETTRSPWTILGATLLSLGGASLVAGATVGGLALQKSADAKRELPLTCTEDLHCRENDEAVVEGRFEPAYQFASAADGLLIGGGILAAAGIIVLIADPHGRHVAGSARGIVWTF